MNDREIIASVRDMQGSDGKEGHWYILGEKQRAALTRLLDATDPAKAGEHAKVLLDEANCWQQAPEEHDADLLEALRAGVLALTEAEPLKKRVAELEAALRIFAGCAYPVAVSINPRGHDWRGQESLDYALSEARRALQGDGQ